MAPLGATDLLRVWERGQGAPHPERALLLLDAAGVDASPERLPVGRRDGHLLALRERLFGRAMVCVTPCPKCGEQLEFPLDTRQFGKPAEPPEDLQLEQGGFRVRFRVPAAADLVACAAEPGVVAAEQRLLRNCVLDARLHEHLIAAEDLPDGLLEALTSAMTEADPGADLRVQATCPLCDHHWESTFDIVSFLWTELQDWALRVLREVHQLALAYGWSERDILELSPRRRRLYLQMVGR
jgi:hypothetical protein